jgi:uncharacterized membrane protein
MSADERHHRWTRWQLFGILAGIWVLVALLFIVLTKLG